LVPEIPRRFNNYGGKIKVSVVALLAQVCGVQLALFGRHADSVTMSAHRIKTDRRKM
jgi:hypothetical protein